MAQAKRYQIFVSSTYKDLKPERREVFEAILELHHLPLGMEMFPASNVAPPEYIKRAIAESDYYVVIVGNRYGSPVPGSGLSFTEMEYDHAVACGVPAIALLHENPSSLQDEFDHEQRAKLEAFRAKLRETALVKYWSSAHELARKASASLTHLFHDEPRPGWVRASDASPQNVARQPLQDLDEEIDLGGTYWNAEGDAEDWGAQFDARSVFMALLGLADNVVIEGLIQGVFAKDLFEQCTGLVVGRDSTGVELAPNSFRHLRDYLRKEGLINVDTQSQSRPWSLTPLGQEVYFSTKA